MQRGEHTWNLFLHYCSCPQCGFVMESRNDYEAGGAGVFQKNLSCHRCGCHFTIKKVSHAAMGPLIGKGEPIEVEWSD